MRSVISLDDLTAADVDALTGRAVAFGAGERSSALAGRAVGVYFQKSSTRTRTSFWRAATRLGAQVITYGPDDLQLTTGETLEDTARVLSGYLDALVVRTNGDIAELRALAKGDIAVVNALTQFEHPTQALADIATLREEFGDLSGRHLLYIGEGNSTAAALVRAAELTPGLTFTVVTPPGYGVPADVLAGKPSRITQHHDLDALPETVDAVYTSRWQTMGVSKADPDWLGVFTPYQVDDTLLERVSHEGTIFLHDLPAVRGQEVTDEVLDGKRSRAWRQAHHKMTIAMAVLEWCVTGSAD
ncbi:ornithine carbamoyltransferase [Actinokineospora cianjurensis]|uniref:Ornithine carbamoyltransferase n=1 Tax=Actinokineospora cianjurensis TaxID=585224 RepID=A0A421B324_9PSEU|nr:ornithine carbamoyltransferase [Actinokineospora cianjurensis]RLK58812.1 ornithine carbamoyltransferase [Actinokineospora cianjurensis]